MKRLITSWDDGHPFDLKIVEILSKYNVEGVFYIPIKNSEGRKTLKRKEIREISKQFEIGGHTYNHVDLTKVTAEKAIEEIYKGKEELEQIIGKKISKFCYPRGHFNSEIKNLVKMAGFVEARNARILSLSKGSDKFSVCPNFHFYPHSNFVYIAHTIKQKDITLLKPIFDTFRGKVGDKAIKLSDWTTGNDLHIWGHSWEIDELDLMNQLEYTLKSINENKRD